MKKLIEHIKEQQTKRSKELIKIEEQKKKNLLEAQKVYKFEEQAIENRKLQKIEEEQEKIKKLEEEKWNEWQRNIQNKVEEATQEIEEERQQRSSISVMLENKRQEKLLFRRQERTRQERIRAIKEKQRIEEQEKVNKINNIIKYRDPLLGVIPWEDWITIPQNKLIAEIDLQQAQRLYEEDLFNVATAPASAASSGGGQKKKKRIITAAFSPNDFVTSAQGGWWKASDLASVGDGNFVTSWGTTTTTVASGLPAFTGGSSIYHASHSNLNDKSAVNFLGTLMSTVDFDMSPSHTQPMTIAAVFSIRDVASPIYFTFRRSTSYGGGFDIERERVFPLLNGSIAPGDLVLSAGGQVPYNIVIDTNFSQAVGTRVIIFTVNGTTDADGAKLYYDSDTPVVTQAANVDTSPAMVAVGYGMVVAEMLWLHDTALTEEQAVQLRAYWRSIYE